jgi:hypothetical protein
MSTPVPCFLDAPSLGSATKIFLDSNLTICAADGFYSDGVITRQLLGCILLPEQPCPSCALPCDGGISYTLTGADVGVYLLNVDTGATPSDVGAIVIKITVNAAPIGTSVLFNGNIYNTLSSPDYGVLSGAPGLPVYVGDVDNDSGLVSGSPYTGVDEYEFDGTSYVATGDTQSFTIVPSQLDLTANNPGTMVMVVPKTAPSPYDLNMSLFLPLTGSDFDFEVSCPAPLPSFLCDSTPSTLATVCASLTPPTTHYTALVNGTIGEHGLYDWVFYDNCGESILDDGYYKSAQCPSGFDYFLVDNGVIIAFGTCSEFTVTAVNGYMEACGPSLDQYMGADVTLDTPVDVDTVFGVLVYYEFPGVDCGVGGSSQAINVTILAGQSSSNFDACASGTYFPSGATICSACIETCDNPSVNISSFICTF